MTAHVPHAIPFTLLVYFTCVCLEAGSTILNSSQACPTTLSIQVVLRLLTVPVKSFCSKHAVLQCNKRTAAEGFLNAVRQTSLKGRLGNNVQIVRSNAEKVYGSCCICVCKP